jgi:hypothetical protein
MFCSCFVVLCIFIFVCTSVGLLPPGESPIAISNNNNNNNNTLLVVNNINTTMEHWWNDSLKGESKYAGKTPVPLSPC